MQMQRLIPAKQFSWCKMILAILPNVMNITREGNKSAVEKARLLVLISGLNDQHLFCVISLRWWLLKLIKKRAGRLIFGKRN